MSIYTLSIVPILIFSGKITDCPPVTIVSPFLTEANLVTSINCTYPVIFPENINIGTIDKVFIDNETNYYTLDIKLFNDMTNLGHVYIIKGKDRQEIINLEKSKEDE